MNAGGSPGTETATELVVVTGASSGIGAAVARSLYASGRRLLLLARRTDRLAALHLDGATVVAVDVADEEAVSQTLAEAQARLGPADALVNCAGVLHLGSFLEHSPESWRRTLDVNVIGAVNTIRAVLPGMLERRAGTIVNISSVAGRQGFADHAAYCASKFALEGLSSVLREEAAPYGVRVVVVVPGVVDTRLARSLEPDGAALERRGDLVRSLEGGLHPEAVAAAVQSALGAPPAECWREIVVTHVREAG